ncbi:MAG: pentapeptide repeat-containing protein [Gammaproteobacteria bacterium]|nr:pentapeptide repeat-containing protein [Gammaproteobacteria bacterium]MDH5651545.1 pentapeptide repeat-containing protein [Gammaproteobacteria bacterium]
MSEKPQIKQDPLYQLLRDGKIDEFNKRKAAGEQCDLTGCDFRNIDLRGLAADGIDFSNSYFHQADLRGVDLRKANLAGASINGARISGVYFPAALAPEEINLSLMHGTRMRYSNK